MMLRWRMVVEFLQCSNGPGHLIKQTEDETNGQESVGSSTIGIVVAAVVVVISFVFPKETIAPSSLFRSTVLGDKVGECRFWTGLKEHTVQSAIGKTVFWQCLVIFVVILVWIVVGFL